MPQPLRLLRKLRLMMAALETKAVEKKQRLLMQHCSTYD
jgi:hypothetical protein